ncbi:MAG: serine/threonine protein kinase [Acidobacteria bacterium]|nr:MAG: serine/threonine protein kinase [Acidobacteriota bacterium]
MVGQVLGHYHIDAKVGEGQFAVLYKARDIRLDRTVAVKVLKENSLQPDTTWGRLLREARMASILNHPNICILYDIGEDQDINYIVLEFVEGKTLRAILDSGPLPVQHAFHFGIQIAEATAYTHGAGILHRDLKCANIMVTPRGRIKLVDFGLSKLVEEERRKEGKASDSSAQEIGWLVGTLPYLAPELLHGEKATTQSGVWSLGVVLFEMLTGELPFSGQSPFELGMDIMTGTMKLLPMTIPAGLRAITQRCLARDKEDRYYSAVEVLNHLQSEYTTFQIRAVLANHPSSQNQWSRAGWLRSLLSRIGWVFLGN